VLQVRAKESCRRAIEIMLTRALTSRLVVRDLSAESGGRPGLAGRSTEGCSPAHGIASVWRGALDGGLRTGPGHSFAPAGRA
jgi:hypothetical protein